MRVGVIVDEFPKASIAGYSDCLSWKEHWDVFQNDTVGNSEVSTRSAVYFSVVHHQDVVQCGTRPELNVAGRGKGDVPHSLTRTWTKQ